jgi:hypothetical protein
LVAELQGLKEEFGDLHIDWKDKFLGVTTEPITLRDVERSWISVRGRNRRHMFASALSGSYG